VFDAPARLLFKAYSTREQLVKWFGPEGWPLTLCEMDFRTGGRFRFAMTGPDGVQNTPFGGFSEGVGSGLDQLADVVAEMRTIEDA